MVCSTDLLCAVLDNRFVTRYYAIEDLPTNAFPFATGYQQIMVAYSGLTVTPYTAAWVKYLSGACPCGNASAWIVGSSRSLPSCDGGCPALVASRVIPGGTLGSTGFGVIQQNSLELRVTALTADPVYSTMPANSSTPILTKLDAPCPSTQVSNEMCGSWTLPCHSIGDAADAAYVATASLFATDATQSCSECYYMNTTYFLGSSGCEDNSATGYVQIEQDGHFGVMGAANANNVPNGNNVQMTASMFTVTPLSSTAVADLQQNCACSGSWAVNTPRSFSSLCPPTECTPSLYRQIFGTGTVFGAFQHIGPNMRITKLQSTKTDGWQNANLTQYDYQYVSVAAACNPDLPSYPVGPNPHPSPATGKHGGTKTMGGGDVFILLLFLTIIVYFGGGMAYHFQRTGGFKNGGTPVIPHVSFWRSIPVLVAEGCHFSITERCGTKKVGPAYSTFGAAPMDSDFGNTTGGASSKNGYGAL
jgi:hypothetical protein